MHITEGAWDGDTPIAMTAEIKDGGGKSLATIKGTPVWDGSVSLSGLNSKLPYDVVITFSSKVRSKRVVREKRSALEPQRCAGCEPPTPRPNYAYEQRMVVVQAGDVTFNSNQRDESQIPHMNVGGWDNNGGPPVSCSAAIVIW